MVTINKIERICENQKLKNRLKEAGIFPLIGPTGPKGEIGPTGPKGENSLSYEGILSGFYNDEYGEETLSFLDKKVFPKDTDIFTTNDTDINIKKGIYEVTLSGIITGVDEDNGGIFYLYNATNDTIINGLHFLLSASNVKEMYFSGTTVVELSEPSVFQVKTEVSGGKVQKVKFNDINILIKKYTI